MEINQEAQEILNNILKLDPEELSLEQRNFLRARRDYLKKDDRNKYRSIITTDEEKAKVAGEEVKEETPDVEVKDEVKSKSQEKREAIQNKDKEEKAK